MHKQWHSTTCTGLVSECIRFKHTDSLNYFILLWSHAQNIRNSPLPNRDENRRWPRHAWSRSLSQVKVVRSLSLQALFDVYSCQWMSTIRKLLESKILERFGWNRSADKGCISWKKSIEFKFRAPLRTSGYNACVQQNICINSFDKLWSICVKLPNNFESNVINIIYNSIHNITSLSWCN